MNRKMLIFTLFVCLSIGVYGQESQSNGIFNISQSFRIVQGEKQIYPAENMNNPGNNTVYSIDNEPFEIYFYGISDFEVFIMANAANNETIQSLTIYPIDLQALFMPGYGYAQDVFIYNLFVNGQYNSGFNYFDTSRRIKEDEYDIVLIDNLVLIETKRELHELEEVQIIVFVDHNQNSIIEENEIIVITLKVQTHY